MLVKHGKHFKAFVVVKGSFVLEKKVQRTVLNCHPDLPLPEAIGICIPGVSDQCVIGVLSGELRTMEVVLDNAMKIEVGF
jgi:hypothetical protein